MKTNKKKFSPLEEFYNLKNAYPISTGINSEYIIKVIEFAKEDELEHPESDYWFKIKTEAIFAELSKNLEDTIAYIDTCSKKELYFICQVFEELSKHFKSHKLIDCIERNITRFDDSELQQQLRTELEYMKTYIKKNIN